MKDLAMNTKLIVRPIIGCLTHSHFWEGPCRAGYREEMTVEAESAAADQAFEAAKKVLEGAAEEIHFLEAVDARYDEKFIVGKDVFAKIEEDMEIGRAHV